MGRGLKGNSRMTKSMGMALTSFQMDANTQVIGGTAFPMVKVFFTAMTTNTIADSSLMVRKMGRELRS